MPCSTRIANSSSLSCGALARVETGGGLVEAQQHRVAAHRTRDLESALLAVGETTGRVVRTPGKAHLVEPISCPVDGRSLGPGIRRRADETEKRHAGSEHERIVLRHNQVLEDGHALEEADILEGAGDASVFGDPEVEETLEQELPAFVVNEAHHALGRLVEAGDAIEDGGLAGPVGANERGDVAAPRNERKVADGDKSTETHGQMVDDQDRVGAAHLRASST